MAGPINLRLTMESGQPAHFIWNREGEGYWRIVKGRRCEVWQQGGALEVTPGFEEYVGSALGLKHDLEAVYAKLVLDDRHLHKAAHLYEGMRLTRSDPWEAVVSYICSINCNIPQIRRNVQALMKNGEVLAPKKLLGMKLPRSLGFRAKYLRETARMVVEKEVDLDDLWDMGYEEAKNELMRLPGVGPKVADCVLLFAYGKGEAFPVDVWVKRAMERLYGVRGEKKIAEYARKKWGENAGYAQQYLFMYARECMKCKKARKKK